MYKGEKNKKDYFLSASQYCFKAVDWLFTGQEISNENKNEQEREEVAGRAGRGKGSTHTPFVHGLILGEKGRSTFFSCICHSTQEILPLHLPVSRGLSEQNGNVKCPDFSNSYMCVHKYVQTG